MRNFIRKIVVKILLWEAKKVLVKYHPRIVGVTGNLGKTSTKDTISAVLATGFTVRSSDKSYNSEFGLPLSVLNLKSGWYSPFRWLLVILSGLFQVLVKNFYPEWLVLELGVDQPNDMQVVVDWLWLDIALMTGMSDPPVHVGNFKNAQELYNEKAKILKGLTKEGTLIVNYDDRITMGLIEKDLHKRVTYGLHKGADIGASNIHLLYREENGKSVPEGLTFKLEYQGKSLPVRLPGVIGKNMVYAALAAISVGIVLKLNVVEMIAALATAKRPKGRLRLLRGIKDTMIIDDTYNSSPAAATLAIETLGSLEIRGKRIAVLGDMLELGSHGEAAHTNLGDETAKVADVIITVGDMGRLIAEGALDAGFPREKLAHFENSKEASKEIAKYLSSGDLVLVKGSQGMRMEYIVKEIIIDQSQSSELLVRQDKDWLAKK